MYDKSTKSVSRNVSLTIAGEWETPDELFRELDANIISPSMPVPALRTPNARSSLLHRMMVLYRTGKGIRCSAARRAVLQIFAAG